jgi:two-component system phosphate regulon sensor histidine kinase PhoR
VKRSFFWTRFPRFAGAQVALLAFALATLAAALLGADHAVVAVFAAGAGFASVLSLVWSRSLEEPVRELDREVESARSDLRAKIEALTQEREEHAILMSAINDAIVAVDRTGEPLFYNSRFALLFGGRGGIAPGRRLWELLRDPEVLEVFRQALDRDQPTAGRVFSLERDSERRYFSLAVSPLRRGAGGVYGAVGVFHDVTALKEAERIRIDFVANVSHELRTPLTAIKGYVDTLVDDAERGAPPEKSFLEAVARNTARLMNLISDLLDLSSLESTETLQKSLVRTEEATGRVLHAMKGAFEAKRQRVETSYGAATVIADPKRLEQVVVNLLDNASKYTPPEGTIRVRWEPAAGDGVVFKVSDTGPGIPKEHQARLFERFYRVDKARSRDVGGTGLGLAIVKHILQRHGGEASVESEPGKGATFSCRFPSGG